MLCPRCGQRDSVQSARSIYEQGTSDSHTYGTGVGYGGDGHWGVGFVGMSGTSQTRLAQRLSPPDYSPVISAWIKFPSMVLLGFLSASAFASYDPSYWYTTIPPISGGVLFGLLALACFVSLCMQAFPGITVRQYRTKSIQDWSQSNYCHRCGCQF